MTTTHATEFLDLAWQIARREINAGRPSLEANAAIEIGRLFLTGEKGRADLRNAIARLWHETQRAVRDELMAALAEDK